MFLIQCVRLDPQKSHYLGGFSFLARRLLRSEDIWRPYLTLINRHWACSGSAQSSYGSQPCFEVIMQDITSTSRLKKKYLRTFYWMGKVATCPWHLPSIELVLQVHIFSREEGLILIEKTKRWIIIDAARFYSQIVPLSFKLLTNEYEYPLYMKVHSQVVCNLQIHGNIQFIQ